MAALLLGVAIFPFEIYSSIAVIPNQAVEIESDIQVATRSSQIVEIGAQAVNRGY
ncbi:MAG: hypothetical protein JKY56_02135 [Kofleriaceae bacterium]|nr:hypothetical protein [Kofleriaceae bacterium]